MSGCGTRRSDMEGVWSGPSGRGDRNAGGPTANGPARRERCYFLVYWASIMGAHCFPSWDISIMNRYRPSPWKS